MNLKNIESHKFPNSSPGHELRDGDAYYNMGIQLAEIGKLVELGQADDLCTLPVGFSNLSDRLLDIMILVGTA